MSSGSPTDFVSRLVREKHKEFLESLDAVVRYFADSDRTGLQASVGRARKTADNLAQVLPSASHPQWLTNLSHCLRRYDEEPQSPHTANLLNSLLKDLRPARACEWKELHTTTAPIHFDDVYSKLRAETTLQSLFDSLVEQLTKIIESGAVDSVRALNALNQLVAIIKANREGSLVADNGLFYFTKTILQRTLIGYLEDNAVIGPAVKAIRATMAEMEPVVVELKDRFIVECREALPATIFTPLGLPSPDEAPRLPTPPNSGDDG